MIINFFANIDNMGVIYRAGFAFLSSAILVVLLGKHYISLVKKSKKLLQPIRKEGPVTHLKKQGTPTLGGILIIGIFWASALFWISEINNIILIVLFVSLSFTLLGFIDDFLKLIFSNTKGLKGKLRLLLGGIISAVAVYYLLSEYPHEISRSVFFPFYKATYIYVGTIGIIVFSAFVILATANSVNLTDGLDGLATLVVSTILSALFFVVILIISPDIYTTFTYGALFYYNNIIEILVVIASLIGALIGFLWYNASPAKIFMGDVGSLGIGSTLGIIIVALKQELFLVVAGIFLILESLSVILQVYYYKKTNKRIFLMAPIHHHFEKKGTAETTVVKRIWIFTILSAVLALLLLDV